MWNTQWLLSEKLSSWKRFIVSGNFWQNWFQISQIFTVFYFNPNEEEKFSGFVSLMLIWCLRNKSSCGFYFTGFNHFRLLFNWVCSSFTSSVKLYSAFISWFVDSVTFCYINTKVFFGGLSHKVLKLISKFLFLSRCCVFQYKDEVGETRNSCDMFFFFCYKTDKRV